MPAMDSTYVAALVLSVAITYATRIGGLLLGARDIPPYVDRVLGYVPLGAFTAIVVLGLTDAGGQLPARVAAMIAAGLIAWRLGILWLALVVGFTVFTALRLVLGS